MAEKVGATPANAPETITEAGPASKNGAEKSGKPKGFFAEHKERKTAERQEKRAQSALQDRRSTAARLDIGEKRLEELKSANIPPTPAEAAERVQLEKDIKEDHRLLAKANLELWKTGRIEKLDTNDLVTIEKDLIENGEKSAMAELILSKQGFNTFEEALRKLNLTNAEYGDKKIEIKDKNLEGFFKSPVVREHLTKLGISGGVSAAALSVIALCSGPVGWAAIGVAGAGVAGGAIGRGVGEFVRGRMLAKKEDGAVDEHGKTKRFNQVVAEDMLQQIVNLQSRADVVEGLRDEQDPNQRAQAILELIQTAASVEGRTAKRYEKMEKRASWIKAGLGILGAIGGAYEASVFVGHEAAKAAAEKVGTTSFNHDLADANAHGVRIFHDAAGHAHVTHDPAYGHIVRNDTDGAWRQVIEHKNITGYNVQPNEFAPGATSHIIGASEVMKHVGHDGYKDVLDYYAGSAPHGVTLQAGVPGHLPAYPLEHVTPVDFSSVEGALRDNLHHAADLIQHDALWAQIIGAGAGVLPVIGMEAAYGKKNKNDKEQRTKDNEMLIGSLSEVEDHLHRNIIMGVGESTAIGKIPEDPAKMRLFAERFALYHHSRLPESPDGYVYNWTEQPQKLDKLFRLDQIPMWYKLHEEVGGAGQKVQAVDQHGNRLPAASPDRTLVKVGIASVDPEHNRIAIIKSVDNYERSKAYYFPVEVMRLDKFLSEHKQFIREEEGKPIIPATSDVANSPDGTSPDSPLNVKQGGETGAADSPEEISVTDPSKPESVIGGSPDKMIFNGQYWEGEAVGPLLVYKETRPDDGVYFGVNDKDTAVYYGSFRSEAAAKEAAARILAIEDIDSYNPNDYLTAAAPNRKSGNISAAIRDIFAEIAGRDTLDAESSLPDNPPEGRPVPSAETTEEDKEMTDKLAAAYTFDDLYDVLHSVEVVQNRKGKEIPSVAVIQNIMRVVSLSPEQIPGQLETISSRYGLRDKVSELLKDRPSTERSVDTSKSVDRSHSTGNIDDDLVRAFGGGAISTEGPKPAETEKVENETAQSSFTRLVNKLNSPEVKPYLGSAGVEVHTYFNQFDGRDLSVTFTDKDNNKHTVTLPGGQKAGSTGLMKLFYIPRNPSRNDRENSIFSPSLKDIELFGNRVLNSIEAAMSKKGDNTLEPSVAPVAIPKEPTPVPAPSVKAEEAPVEVEKVVLTGEVSIESLQPNKKITLRLPEGSGTLGASLFERIAKSVKQPGQKEIEVEISSVNVAKETVTIKAGVHVKPYAFSILKPFIVSSEARESNIDEPPEVSVPVVEAEELPPPVESEPLPVFGPPPPPEAPAIQEDDMVEKAIEPVKNVEPEADAPTVEANVDDTDLKRLRLEKIDDLTGKTITIDDPAKLIAETEEGIITGEFHIKDINSDAKFTVSEVGGNLIDVKLNGGTLTIPSQELLSHITSVS